MGKYVSFDNLSRYDGKIKEYIDVNSSKIGKLEAYDYSTAENALVLESLKPGVYILWTNGGFDIHFKSLESSSGTRHIYVSGSPEKLILILTQTPTSTLNEWSILGAILTNSIGFSDSAVYTTNYILYYKTSNDGNLEIETVQATTDATIADTNTAQTISGKKTFSTLPESSEVPTTDDQLTNKKYVDDTVSSLADVARTGDYNDLTNKPITYSTTDINPGDALESGSLYIVYE